MDIISVIVRAKGGILLKRLFGQKNQNIESDSYMRALREYKKLSSQDFNNVQKRLGLDGATCFSHLYFSGTSYFKRFKKELELHSMEYSLDNNDHEIIIVVPDSRLGNELQNDRLVQQIIKHSIGSGFLEVTRVDLKSISAIDGARQLAKYLKERKKRRKVILASFSHSSASVRIMLDQLESDSLSKIKGWVNIAGLIFGSPLYFCSKKRSGIFGKNVELMRSYSSEQKYFLKPLRESSVKTVHFIGTKVSSQMGIVEKRRYGFLKPWGPNDGMIAFSSYQRLKAPVVSVMGQGHFIDLDSVEITFKRSLCSIVGLVPKGAALKKWTKPLEKDQSVDKKVTAINY